MTHEIRLYKKTTIFKGEMSVGFSTSPPPLNVRMFAAYGNRGMEVWPENNWAREMVRKIFGGARKRRYLKRL